MESIAEYIKEERDVLFLRGLDKGQQTEQMKVVTNLIQKLNLPFEQIADIAGVTVDFVKAVHRQLDSKNHL